MHYNRSDKSWASFCPADVIWFIGLPQQDCCISPGLELDDMEQKSYLCIFRLNGCTWSTSLYFFSLKAAECLFVLRKPNARCHKHLCENRVIEIMCKNELSFPARTYTAEAGWHEHNLISQYLLTKYLDVNIVGLTAAALINVDKMRFFINHHQ